MFEREEICSIGEEIEVELFPESKEEFQYIVSSMEDEFLIGFKTDKLDVVQDIFQRHLYRLQNRGVSHDEAHNIFDMVLAACVLINTKNDDYDNFLEVLYEVSREEVDHSCKVYWPVFANIEGDFSFAKAKKKSISSSKRKELLENEHFHFSGKHISMEEQEDVYEEFSSYYDRLDYLEVRTSLVNPIMGLYGLIYECPLAEECFRLQQNGGIEDYEEEHSLLSRIKNRLGYYMGIYVMRKTEKECTLYNAAFKVLNPEIGRFIVERGDVDFPFPVLIKYNQNGDPMYDEFVANYEIKHPDIFEVPSRDISDIFRYEIGFEDYLEALFVSDGAEQYEKRLKRAIRRRSKIGGGLDNQVISLYTILEVIFSKGKNTDFDTVAERAASLYTEDYVGSLKEDRFYEESVTELKGLLREFKDIRNNLVHEGRELDYEKEFIEVINCINAIKDINDVCILNMLFLFSQDEERSYNEFLRHLDLKYLNRDVSDSERNENYFSDSMSEI